MVGFDLILFLIFLLISEFHLISLYIIDLAQCCYAMKINKVTSWVSHSFACECNTMRHFVLNYERNPPAFEQTCEREAKMVEVCNIL